MARNTGTTTNSTNFHNDFRKKYKPQNGKKGMQGEGARSVHHSLPRNHKSSSPISAKPKTGPPAFDDFADGFDARYKLVDFKESMKDFLAEPDRSVRLKALQSTTMAIFSDPSIPRSIVLC
jgi:hypothetical protein